MNRLYDLIGHTVTWLAFGPIDSAYRWSNTVHFPLNDRDTP